ncbi:SDR family oxidoreductase [Paenibacillus psychroresistens]|uniref:SDR family oxidoreductase n=1 Tax=Paenibacillus psychroresistens TaxID=1778678 RepID=A0A6B8RNA0_9BACL|nr:SDR family NAD(P)-dependent oxidoreductase [Paenibacillus psychroresistens]QGQ97244.1 SDR family oxidoreductase [Paenibacillus psychroresistens]
MQLKGKVAIISGAGSGIGEATAKLFASLGAKVVIADWNEAEANRVANEINLLDSVEGKALAVKTDVSSEQQVKLLVQETLTVFGAIDILFNNAAVVLPKELEDITEVEWTRTLDINLKSVYLMIKYCIPEIRKSRGSIVNMSSLSGLLGQKQNPVYSATKGAIIAMTKALALDYAKDGVRVNCICPAGVMTPLLEEWIQQQPDPTETVQALIDMHPLGRCATTEEIAQAVLYLASEQAYFITGVALPVDGGASLGY